MIALSLYFTLLRARGFLVFLSERYSDIINNREKNLIPHFTAIPSPSIPLLSPLTVFGLLPLSLSSFNPRPSYLFLSPLASFSCSYLLSYFFFSISSSFSYFPFWTLHSFSLYYLGFSYFSLLCHLLIFLIFLSPFHSSFDLLSPQVFYFFPFKKDLILLFLLSRLVPHSFPIVLLSFLSSFPSHSFVFIAPLLQTSLP
uniref:Uncharacterized protein n=1 Tax=Cacopsylla melanoneura TaxID=428564 RepID=A0A8D9BGW0_9HEMI